MTSIIYEYSYEIFVCKVDLLLEMISPGPLPVTNLQSTILYYCLQLEFTKCAMWLGEEKLKS